MSWILARLSSTVRSMLAIVAAVLGAITYHRYSVRSARRSGGATERDRVEAETHRRAREIREDAHEIDRDHSDISRDDLRGRMREQARDRDTT